MSAIWVDVGSVWRGIRAMKRENKARWYVGWMPRRFWLHAWTPIWQAGRGPYISCGLFVIAFYRGY